MDTRRIASFAIRTGSLGLMWGLILSLSLAGRTWGALSGRTERARRLISQQHCPAAKPAMDARQQFIVFSPDTRLSRELLGELLGLRQRVYRFFGVSKVWEQPAFVLIFPSKEKYGLAGSGGAAIQFRYHGEDVRIIGSYLQEGLRERILPHEMVHFLIKDLSAVGAARGGEPPQLPVFIEEGIVEYFAAPQPRRILFEKNVWEAFQAGKLESFKKNVTTTGAWTESVVTERSSWPQRCQAYSVVSFLAGLPRGNVKLKNYIMSYGTLANRVPPGSACLRAFEMAFRQDYSSWEGLQNRWMGYIREREFVIVEGEGATVTASSGEKWEVRRASSPMLPLSGGKELCFHASGKGSFLTLESTAPAPGAYDVYAIYVQRPNGGQFGLAINATPFPRIFDGYAREERLCEPIHYGKSVVGGGEALLRFSVVGKQVISGGYEIGIDCVFLRRDRALERKNEAAAKRHMEVGARDYQRRDFKRAEGSLSEAIRLAPWDAGALEWRAYVRMALGRLNEAKQDMDAALRLKSDSPRLTELRKQIEEALGTVSGSATKENPPEGK